MMTLNKAKKVAQEFQIPAMYLPTVEAKIAKLNKKAIKFGIEPIAYTVDRTPIPVTITIDELLNKITYEAITVILETDSTVRINGWTLLAKITHEAFGNIVNTVPGIDADLTFYRDRGCYCDHCNTFRRRNDTFIIQNEAGEIKQIGRQCLADYLRTDGAADIISAYESLRINESSFRDEDFMAFARKVETFPVSTLIAYAFKSIDLYGYKSKKMMMDQDGFTTAQDMACIMAEKLMNGASNPDYISPESLDMTEIPAIVDYLKAKFAAPKNDFEHNMSMIASAEFMTRQYFGHIAYAAQTFRKDRQEKIAADNKPMKASEYQGSIGDKIQVTVTLLRETPIETAYGTSYLWVMQDEEGNKYTWFASNPPDISEGEQVTIKGTVKAHNLYNGEEQTVMTRCKVV